jgi:hypothetical protein
MKLYQVTVVTAAILGLTGVCLAAQSVALKVAAPAKSCPLCAKTSQTAPAPSASTASKTPAIPDVTLPFTFTCPHCSMQITIKTKADWTKSCPDCACGVNNIGCYNDSLKKKK